MVKTCREPGRGAAIGGFKEDMVETSRDGDGCEANELCGIAGSCPCWQHP
jgi:hypothetical protein